MKLKKSLVKFVYLVATLNLLFLLDLKSNDTSSRSAIVCTSIQSSGTATTKLAFPKSSLRLILILSRKFLSDSLRRSKPETPISRVPSPNL